LVDVETVSVTPLLVVVDLLDSVLLGLQKLPVSSNLEIQSDLDAHQLLVLPELGGHRSLESVELLSGLLKPLLVRSNSNGVLVLLLGHLELQASVLLLEHSDLCHERSLTSPEFRDGGLETQKLSRVIDVLLLDLLHLDLGQASHLGSVLGGQSLVVLSHPGELGENRWVLHWRLHDSDVLSLGELFFERSDLLAVGASDELDLFDAGLESSGEVDSEEG
jgi:hypothetical protein